MWPHLCICKRINHINSMPVLGRSYLGWSGTGLLPGIQCPSYYLSTSMLTAALQSSLPEDILLASLTREVNTEIAPCNREVGVALNYSRSLLLMNALYEPLKTVQIQCHCSACNCWAVRQDNHAPQECHIWKSVVTQLSPLPKLLSNLCRRFDEMLLHGN